jgi:hypothetical protein
LPNTQANHTAVAGGALRLRLDAEHEERLAHSLWTLDPVPLLCAVRVPLVALVAQTGDERQDRPRIESLERARAVLADRLDARLVPGGHDLPLQRPYETACAIADAAARIASLV